MAKWADFLISAVRFNPRGTHIDFLRVHPDNDSTVGPSMDYPRQTIVDAIREGTTLMTIVSDSNNQWAPGQRVYIVNIHGTDYLKTYDDRTTRDNLDDLPRF